MIEEISGLLVHSVANIMPMMSSAELDALAIDIQENGLREPIWLWKNKSGIDYLLDGRNRSLACERVGVIPEYRYYEGDESSLLNFVISLNISRRHLNSGQRACLAVDILPMIEEQNEASRKEKISKSRSTGESSGTGEKSRDVAGKLFSVSGKYISNAKRVKENIELFEQVKAGSLSLTKAITMLGKVETVELIPSSQEENVEVVAETVELVPPSEPLSKSENKKVLELVEFGMSEQRAREYIISKRRVKSTVVKPKSSYAGRVEIKMPEEQKELLMQQAKSNNMSLSEYIRTLINKG